MPIAGGFDAQIAGIGIRFARNREDVPGLQFLDAPNEPARPGGVGTIVYDNFHAGIGRAISPEPDRYRFVSGKQAVAWIPGIIATGGDYSVLTDGASNETGAVESSPFYASSFQQASDVYFVMSAKVLKLANGGANWAQLTGSVPAAGNSYMGWPALYQNKWWVGLATTTTGVASGYAYYDAGAASWTSSTAGMKANLLFPAHGGMFKVEITAITGGAATWTLSYTTAVSPTAVVDWTAIASNVKSGVPTAMHTFGRVVLVFTRDGEMIAIDGASYPRSLVPPGLLASQEADFGHGTRVWGGGLMVVSQRALMAVSAERATGRAVSPVDLNGHLGARLYRPSALAQYGADLVVGTRSGTFLGNAEFPNLLLLKNYAGFDEPRYHIIQELQSGITSGWYVRAVEVLSGGEVIVLLGNASTGRIVRQYVPSLSGTAPATRVLSHVWSTMVYGPSSGKKLTLQLRLYNPEVFTGSAEAFIESDVTSVQVPNSISAGTFNAAGPTILTGARIVGRAFAVVVDLPAGGASQWPRVLPPIFLDYMDLPAPGDRVRIPIEHTSSPGRYANQTKSKEGFLKTIRDLRDGAAKTFKLLGAAGTPAEYTVMIESVESAEAAPNLVREYPGAVAVITAKIMTTVGAAA